MYIRFLQGSMHYRRNMTSSTHVTKVVTEDLVYKRQ
jgi:hypothetical protein